MDEKLPPPTQDEQEQRLEQERDHPPHVSDERRHRAERGRSSCHRDPVVAYLLGPITRRKEYLEWVDIGRPDFQPGETTLVTFAIRSQLRGTARPPTCPPMCAASEPGEYTVFAINCAHLGCPVRWFSESQLFMCPCHGGVYYADGSRASGPPERGLFTYDKKIENGQLMINAGQMPTLSEPCRPEPCPTARRDTASDGSFRLT